MTIANLSGAGTTKLGSVNLTITPTGTQVNSGPILGATGGALTINGSGTQVLGFLNSYTGGTTIQSGILSIPSDSSLGNTSGPITINGGTLQAIGTVNSPATRPYIIGASGGTIDTNSKAMFIQGGLSSNGGNLTIENSNAASGVLGGVYIYNTNSFSQTLTMGPGTTLNLVSFGTVAPCILPANIVLQAGSILTGNGTIGSLNSTGTVSAGASIGTIVINGNMTLNGGSNLVVEVGKVGSTDVNDLYQVIGGTVTLGGTLTVNFDGTVGTIYTLSDRWTFITSPAVVGGAFAVVSAGNSPFAISYLANDPAVGDVTLFFLANPSSFANVPLFCPGSRTIADLLTPTNTVNNPQLLAYITALSTESPDVIASAIKLLDPGPYSAAADAQSELASQVVDLLHHWPYKGCKHYAPNRVWIEPFGNWYREKGVDCQLGFKTNSEGVAIGYDYTLGSNWLVGAAGIFDHAELKWRWSGSNARANTFYGAAYADYIGEHTHLGFTVMGGWDRYKMNREINILSTDETAHSKHGGAEFVASVEGSLEFDLERAFVISPFINFNSFYLDMDDFTEHGAAGFDLTVNSYSSHTARGEFGVGGYRQSQFSEKRGCLSLAGYASYVIQSPLHRDKLTANFPTVPSFTVPGWDHSWQFFSPSGSVQVDYDQMSFSVQYKAEIGIRFLGQRADIRFDWRW